MDKRPKVLLVEDDPIFREALAASLKSHDFRVRACASLAESLAAIRELRFDIALLDISLNGPLDMSNRDGLRVLSSLKDAGDGTKTLVLTGHDDPGLIHDVWKDYGGDDYISKGALEREGLAYLLKTIDAPAKRESKSSGVSWNSLVRMLAPSEEEASFVHRMMSILNFRGGLPALQSALLDACKLLVPLIPSKQQAFKALDAPDAASGIYWSRGQGSAIEIFLRGSAAETADIAGSELYRRSKGGLNVQVVARPDLTRAKFVDG
jgi:DNA-binding NarL/FixJ family response regulator